MEWWAPVLVGGVALVVAGLFNEEARRSRREWESRRSGLDDEIRDHRRRLGEHLQYSAWSVEFRQLADEHYKSVQFGDQAYQVMRNAIRSRDEVRRAAWTMAAQMEALYRRAQSPGLVPAARESMYLELRTLKALKANLHQDSLDLTSQVDHFVEELRGLNQQTHALKERIRDDCGPGGRIWYQRMEERRQLRGR